MASTQIKDYHLLQVIHMSIVLADTSVLFSTRANRNNYSVKEAECNQQTLKTVAQCEGYRRFSPSVGRWSGKTRFSANYLVPHGMSSKPVSGKNFISSNKSSQADLCQSRCLPLDRLTTPKVFTDLVHIQIRLRLPPARWSSGTLCTHAESKNPFPILNSHGSCVLNPTHNSLLAADGLHPGWPVSAVLQSSQLFLVVRILQYHPDPAFREGGMLPGLVQVINRLKYTS